MSGAHNASLLRTVSQRDEGVPIGIVWHDSRGVIYTRSIAPWTLDSAMGTKNTATAVCWEEFGMYIILYIREKGTREDEASILGIDAGYMSWNENRTHG